MSVAAPVLTSSGPGGAPEVIRAEHLEISYAGKAVWRDATFSVRRGEFVAVIGPNGAGKTTLFRLLLGLVRPTAGTLRVFDQLPSRGDARIGYVPQRHTVDHETHVAADTLVGLGYSGARWGTGFARRADREAAAAALEAVGASELGPKCLGTMSGGELQRVFLAEALVGNPSMLLLDEPLSNLDMRRSRELVEVVHGLVQSKKVTTLLVAHDINPLIQCLDKVIYVANGNVATGSPETVLTSDSLTRLYGVPVEVLRDSRNHLVIVGGEDSHGGENG